MPVPHCFGYCNFVVGFEIRACESSTLPCFPRLFWLLGIPGDPIRIFKRAFLFPRIRMSFAMGFSISERKKKKNKDFDRDCNELLMA